MWVLRMFFVLFLLGDAATSCAQEYKDDTLFLAGIDLKLGMQKDVIIQGIKGIYSLQIDTSAPDNYSIMEKSLVTEEFRLAGTLKFVNNRLSFASKQWVSECKDVVAALHAILSKSRPSGEGYAWFRTQTRHEPNISYIGITIAVGKRRITVSSGVVKDVGQVVSVEEVIGGKIR